MNEILCILRLITSYGYWFCDSDWLQEDRVASVWLNDKGVRTAIHAQQVTQLRTLAGYMNIYISLISTICACPTDRDLKLDSNCFLFRKM